MQSLTLTQDDIVFLVAGCAVVMALVAAIAIGWSRRGFLQREQQWQLAMQADRREWQASQMADRAADEKELQLLRERQLQLTEQLQEKTEQAARLQSEYQSLQTEARMQQASLQEQLKLLKDTKEQLGGQFELLANRIFEDKQKQFGQQSQQLISHSVDPLREQLQSFRKKVEDVYEKESADRNRLVGQITELQKQTQQIGDDAVHLAKALKGDNKTQGNWGEVILERILESSGLQRGREYEVQVALKDEEGRRRNPDVIVRLPSQKDIIIDAKVSLNHYERFCASEDAQERSLLLRQHVQSVRSHVQQLSVKAYEQLEGVRTLDFVFIFIPVEAAYMAALQEEPGLFSEAYDQQIILVSPTTLLASLRTVENIWRYEKQNKNAEEIARQAGGLYDQFVLVLESLDETGKQIAKAQESFDQTRRRLSEGRGNVIKRVESLKQLGAKTKRQLPEGELASVAADEGGHTPKPLLES